MEDVIKRAADAIIDAAVRQNIPVQGTAMKKFAQFEDELEAHFDAFHDGILSRHKLRKYLLSQGYTRQMAHDEIKQQIDVKNFKLAARARDRRDNAIQTR